MATPPGSTGAGEGPEAQSRGEQRGQSMVELALLAPLLLMITLGTLDLGRMMYGYVAVSSAAQAGAEFAARTGTTDRDLVRSVIFKASGGYLTAANTAVDGDVEIANGARVKVASVTVVYTFSPLAPIPVNTTIPIRIRAAAPISAL